MNWGTRIALLYISFAVFILTMAFLATREHFDLVTENYYEKEQEQNGVLNALKNYQTLEEGMKVSWKAESTSLLISFPKDAKPVNGDVWVYCPTDSRKDLFVPVQIDADNLQEISGKDLKRGRYKVKVSWETAEKPYFCESTIIVP
jgi:hypothetical protein